MEPGGDGFFGIINHPPPPPAPDDVIIIELYPLLWGGTDELHWGSSDRLVYD